MQAPGIPQTVSSSHPYAYSTPSLTPYGCIETRLNEELEFYLDKAVKKSQEKLPIKGTRAIIGP